MQFLLTLSGPMTYICDLWPWSDRILEVGGMFVQNFIKLSAAVPAFCVNKEISEKNLATMLKNDTAVDSAGSNCGVSSKSLQAARK